jgi:predicted ribosomally synthesized peptide with nif11-like leader
MSTDDAGAFLQRLEDDEAFALRMQEVSGNPEATHQRAAEEGFHFTPDEMIETLGDRYGIELTTEQLEAVAAGDDTATIVAGAVGGTVLAGVAIGAAAAAAAIF